MHDAGIEKLRAQLNDMDKQLRGLFGGLEDSCGRLRDHANSLKAGLADLETRSQDQIAKASDEHNRKQAAAVCELQEQLKEMGKQLCGDMAVLTRDSYKKHGSHESALKDGLAALETQLQNEIAKVSAGRGQWHGRRR